MVFNSLEFCIFFPLVTILFFLTPQTYRWLLLLTVSCYFYMQFVPYYILILATIIVIDYIAGIRIENAHQKKTKKLFLMVSVVANLSILFVFKYYNFFLQTAQQTFGNVPLPYLNLILPIGLSFHTLQAMSYTIEVYRGNFRSERHIGKYALYVLFYPQLVAGPIERPQHLLPQWDRSNVLLYSHVAKGLKMMLWGFFKKLVIADRLAVLVNTVYSDIPGHDPLSVLAATYFFAFQIYCDFSGYSDIAIGAAKVMGYDLMENFKLPYLSTSVREFWTRWHISLSSWLKDYVYIPLGGNRVKRWKWYYNLLVVFILSGLWHGANVTFLIWGLIHGFYLIVSLIITKRKVIHANHLIRVGKMILTFHLVLFAWIFFRASSFADAAMILRKLSDFSNYAFRNMKLLNEVRIEFTYTTIVLLLLFILTDPFMDLVIKGKRKLPTWSNYAVFALVLTAIVVTGYFGKIEFIYFKF